MDERGRGLYLDPGHSAAKNTAKKSLIEGAWRGGSVIEAYTYSEVHLQSDMQSDFSHLWLIKILVTSHYLVEGVEKTEEIIKNTPP